jgi:PmbA protein
MGMQPELARDVLASVRHHGATEADVLVVDSDASTTQVRLRDLESLKSAQERRLHLRVLFGKSSAATSTSDFSRRALNDLVDETCTLARATAADEFLGLPTPESMLQTWPDLGLCDHQAQNLEIAEKISLAKQAEAAALDYDPRITNSEGAALDTHVSQIVYANTHGFVGEYRTSAFTLAVSPIAAVDGTMQRDSWYAVNRHFKRLEAPETIGRIAAQRALRRLGARQVPTQEVPVVFDPDMAASLLASWSAPCQEHRSIVVAPSWSTVWDSGSRPTP